MKIIFFFNKKFSDETKWYKKDEETVLQGRIEYFEFLFSQLELTRITSSLWVNKCPNNSHLSNLREIQRINIVIISIFITYQYL